MTDEPTPTPTVPAPESAGPAPAPLTPEQAAQLRTQSAEHRERARELEQAVRKLETQLRGFEDRDKTELERERDAREKAEAKLVAAQAQLMHAEVAQTKQLPLELVKTLHGKDRAAVEAAADKIVEYTQGQITEAVQQATGVRPRRDATDALGNAGPVTEPADMNQFIRSGLRR